MESNTSDIEQSIYSPTDISLLIGGIAAAFATIVYSCKHIKKSSCCGFKCEQVVVDDPCDDLHQLPPSDDESNPHTIKIEGQLKHNIIMNSTDV
tara:strand:+ start:172 stop:453 length:282 start_codon:yes stop_codon:yes gene_type:complete